MKKTFVVLMVMVVLAVGTIPAMAKGSCDRSAWGNDETWETYKAGSEYIEVRTCISKYGSSYIDIKNTNDYDICITVTNSKGQRWPGWPLDAYAQMDKQTSGTNVTWQVGAVRKGAYCKSSY